MTRLEQATVAARTPWPRPRRLGFAEADPSADLDGLDAAAKLSILAYRAFGAWVRPDAFPVRGIREHRSGRLRSGRVDGLPHPPARARRPRRRRARHGGRADAAAGVAPAGLGRRGIQRGLPSCASSGDLSLFGKGAGALPTATAVLGDLIDLAQDNSVRWPVPQAAAARRRGRPSGHRRAGTTCASPASRIPGLDRRIESLVRRAGLTVQNRAARGDGDAVHLGFMSPPGSRRPRSTPCAHDVARLARVHAALVPRGARMSGARALARSAALPAERAARSRPWRPTRARCTTGSTPMPAEPACPTCIPTSPPCSRTCFGSARVIAWQEGKAAFLFASRGLLVGTAAALRALRHDRDRGAHRAGSRHSNAPARRWSAIRACRRRRSSSTC